jgi:hypothetical protein
MMDMENNPSGSAIRLRLRFGAVSRDEALEKRVPRHSCEAATAGWFELSPYGSAIANHLVDLNTEPTGAWLGLQSKASNKSAAKLEARTQPSRFPTYRPASHSSAARASNVQPRSKV